MRQEAKVEAKGLPIDSLGSDRIVMAVLSLIVYVKVVSRIPSPKGIYVQVGRFEGLESLGRGIRS